MGCLSRDWGRGGGIEGMGCGLGLVVMGMMVMLGGRHLDDLRVTNSS